MIRISKSKAEEKAISRSVPQSSFAIYARTKTTLNDWGYYVRELGQTSRESYLLLS